VRAGSSLRRASRANRTLPQQVKEGAADEMVHGNPERMGTQQPFLLAVPNDVWSIPHQSVSTWEWFHLGVGGH